MDYREIAGVLALAASQHNVVSTEQAAAIGVSAPMLRKAAARGWLRAERRSVYAVAGAAPSMWTPVMAAALAGGPDAVISHRSAAVIHGFHGIIAPEPELTVPHGPGRRLQGFRIHQSRRLGPVDVEVRKGVQVTTPIRTVIDLAPTVSDDLLGKILDEGTISRLWTAEQVRSRLDHLGGSGRTGSRRLQKLLALRLGEGFPASRLEQHVLRVLRQDPATPPFMVHHVVYIAGERFELDMAWPELKIDGEVDGMAVRSASRSKFERECRRENILAAHGWRIVHFTAEMDDATILAEFARLLPAA